MTGVLRAEEYGVPQTRRRAILIAHQFLTPALPVTTHQRFRRTQVQTTAEQSALLPCRSIGQTLNRLEPFELVSNYGTGGDPKARGRRTSKEPAFTVTGKVSRNRLFSNARELDRLKLSEAGLLQTFPANYPWSGKDVSQQIGNAIPPRLAAHVLAAALGLELHPSFYDTATRRPWSPAGKGLSNSALPEAVHGFPAHGVDRDSVGRRSDHLPTPLASASPGAL